MKSADSEKEHVRLKSCKNASNGKIIKTVVLIAKNYLNIEEIKLLDRFVTMYLDYAETQTEKNIPMSMEDWAGKLNAFLQFNEKDILTNAGKVSHAIAKAFAESELKKYSIVQDRLFQSDYNKLLDGL